MVADNKKIKLQDLKAYTTTRQIQEDQYASIYCEAGKKTETKHRNEDDAIAAAKYSSVRHRCPYIPEENIDFPVEKLARSNYVPYWYISYSAANQ